MAGFFKKNKSWRNEIEPDEIFLDSENLPDFNVQQFEGRIEKPIPKSTIFFLGIFFLIIGGAFGYRLTVLQVEKGAAYFERSENNSLNKVPVFADRGIIYDRNMAELAWNIVNPEDGDFLKRTYINLSGLSHVVGYISYPAKDKSGNYWQKQFIGRDGVEKQYDSILKGRDGSRLTETDASGAVQSENISNPPVNGENIILSIDAKIQHHLYESLKSFAENYFFKGGTGVLMDVQNGEILALADYPEYDSEILSLGDDAATIKNYLNDKRKPFLNRAVSGLYAPGSIVKPFVALGALNEGVIDPWKQILANGTISVPNPYDKNRPSVFKDWKVHGLVDMRKAIAVSSDIYFYEVAGGFEGQKGMGIMNVGKYARLFGLGLRAGIDLPGDTDGAIPDPAWKEINFPGDPWRLGDTYNTSIGQYGFQVTPLQMARGAAAIANRGTLLRPHVVMNPDLVQLGAERIEIPDGHFTVIHEGMRQAVLSGTAARLNTPDVEVAGKSGTAQVGLAKDHVNSWIIGFFPYKNPRFAFAVMMENGPVSNSVGVSLVMRELFDYMAANAPQYLTGRSN